MNVTPEIVRAEIDYRLERVLTGSELDHVREARRLHRHWWQRVFGQDAAEPSTPENEARPAA